MIFLILKMAQHVHILINIHFMNIEKRKHFKYFKPAHKHKRYKQVQPDEMLMTVTSVACCQKNT